MCTHSFVKPMIKDQNCVPLAAIATEEDLKKRGTREEREDEKWSYQSKSKTKRRFDDDIVLGVYVFLAD